MKRGGEREYTKHKGSIILIEAWTGLSVPGG
jgi:hypothetical protein